MVDGGEDVDEDVDDDDGLFDSSGAKAAVDPTGEDDVPMSKRSPDILRPKKMLQSVNFQNERPTLDVRYRDL